MYRVMHTRGNMHSAERSKAVSHAVTGEDVDVGGIITPAGVNDLEGLQSCSPVDQAESMSSTRGNRTKPFVLESCQRA